MVLALAGLSTTTTFFTRARATLFGEGPPNRRERGKWGRTAPSVNGRRLSRQPQWLVPPQGEGFFADPAGTPGALRHPMSEALRTGGHDAAAPRAGLDGRSQECSAESPPRAVAALAVAGFAVAQPAAQPNDAQIAHIAYTAGVIDIAAAKLALAKSKNAKVREFAEEMERDHTAVNDKALALVKKLGVTPQDNPTSQSMSEIETEKRDGYAKLSGHAFDVAYAANEVAYHKMVNGALQQTLIPDAQNAELKSLLQTGLKLFQMHEQHAEQLVAALK